MIRRSRAEDAASLTEALYASRSIWNYPAAYAEASKPLLRVTPEFIEENCVFQLMDDDKLLGFYSFCESDLEIELNNFWLVPDVIGQGLGRKLWDHALSVAIEKQWKTFFILPDPGALGFYLRMGAQATGTKVPSRLLEGPTFEKLIKNIPLVSSDKY